MRLCDLGSRIIMNAVSLLTDDCVYLFIKGKKLSFAHNISFLEVGFCVLSNLFSKVTLLLFCRNIIIRSKNFLQIKSCPWHVWSKFKFFPCDDIFPNCDVNKGIYLWICAFHHIIIGSCVYSCKLLKGESYGIIRNAHSRLTSYTYEIIFPGHKSFEWQII